MDETRFDLGTVAPTTSIASLMGRLPDGYAAREEYEAGLRELAELRAAEATADEMLSEFVVLPSPTGDRLLRRYDLVAATSVEKAGVCTVRAKNPDGSTYSFDTTLSITQILALLDGKPVVAEAPKPTVGSAIPANTHPGEWKSSPPDGFSTAVDALRWIESDCAEFVRKAGMGEDLPPVEDLARRYVRVVNPWRTNPTLMEPALSAIKSIWSDANGQLLGRCGGWMPTPSQFALSVGATARSGIRDEREWEPTREATT